MADRYWVGGSGSWNSTTKWSATSGGASGASVPTASDNAIFDANSATAHYTVTVTDNATCADLTFTPEPANGVTQFAVGNNFVIAGTFSTSGTQGNRRVWFRSSTFGLMRDMQIATIGTVTDVDFREIRVTGTGGTLTGTRIGDLRGNLGITFSTPKNCYRIGTGNWSDDQWSDTSGGSVSTDNFPLAQDTAVFDESTTGGTHTMNNALIDVSGIDMSARTSALTLSLTSGQRIHGNWTFGSGITITGAQLISFYGRNTQVITSAGKTFSGSIFVVSYGGTVELADALNTGNNSLVITNGTFDTKGYNVTAGQVTSTNSNVREIKLGASTVTCGGDISFTTSTNLTLDAGTSSIICSGSAITFNGGSQTFYDVSFTSTNAATHTFTGANTFNNLSITAPASAGLRQVALAGNQTITGTLTVAGATAVRRTMLRSSVVGTTRTLTVGTLSADDCDFRDITIAGTAAGGSPTRAGDCGGNSGVTFPAPKTVYWNLAGSQNWSATAWATTSGGSPATNNFPLAQDTAVFDNTGSAGTVTVQTFNIGTVDMSARTSAMTLTPSSNAPTVYGSWSFGTGVTSSSASGTITFAGLGTSTITSNGVVFGNPITIACGTGTVQLADALELDSARTLTLTSGTFDAVSYNVTAGRHSCSVSGTTLKMGSGTWTLSGTGNVWTASGGLTLYKGTADILLSNTTTTARTFQGSSLSYNKLTIGGATGTSTLTISSNNQFTELASTKTVAHTIALGSTTQTFGKWSVTGTSGNVVTLTGTGTSHILAGSCTSGIDYLAIGSIRFAATSPAEFYAGANSTATGSPAAPTYLTDKPADSTRYWVGGTGNWNDTNKWSTSSGGAGGADLPRSHDDVVFDSSSNATAYTATVNAITGGNRCKALTIAGPASGNVTLAGSTALFIHDDITLPATGLTRTYTGAINLSGTGAGKTITTNGVALANSLNVNGVGAEWSLADALTTTNIITSNFGSFNTANYNLTVSSIFSNVNGSRAFTFGSSIVSISNTINFGTVENVRANLTFSAGTSQVNFTNSSPSSLDLNNQTFYNVSFTSTSISTVPITGANTFNNLTVAGRTSAGIGALSLTADQTINGTLTLSAGTNATMRTFVRSNTLGTTRTLTCAAVASLTDIDFRDITIAGGAAPVSGTRLGDCKGNTGITFAAGTDKYWNLAGGGNWLLRAVARLATTTSHWHRTPACLRREARTLAIQSLSTHLTTSAPSTCRPAQRTR
jgi:trimeric autotransporter adhesin